ncbi:MAG: Asp-tRNA(Asn)/Glu-tRNA(Gln) amidotransferase subunit GatC [Campylobacterales bacterium]|nr:Asp-tRNA(Asn)/Glu-tRNA(Gln) amidotransferase subunit GatC [Campylobacterales bacterium]
MVIDNTTVDKLAKLSSLQIDEEKKETIAKELADIVTFVENLNEVDVSHVEATFTTISGGLPLREDKSTTDKELTDAIMANAPKAEDHCFVVPTIIE